MTKTKGCPEPETLALLVEGRLSEAESGDVRAHVADCPDCFATVSGTIRFLADEGSRNAEPVPVIDPFGRRTAWVLAVAASILLAFGALQLYRLARPAGLVALVRAVGHRRLIEPRVSVGFDYAPFPSPRRGPVAMDRSNPADWRVFEAAERIRQDAGRAGAGFDDRRALGVAHLVLGNLTEAIGTLEGLARSRPGDAVTRSDLAAAYLVRADATDGSEDLVRAIDAARHAVEIDPDLLEARFNLALALEKQVESGDAGSAPRPDAAIAAWEEYLRRDAGSPWAEEAHRRLSALRERSSGLPVLPEPEAVEHSARAGDFAATLALIRPSPRVGREVFERRLLPAWGAARQEQRAAAASETLAAGASLARAIAAASGDELANDTIAGIAEAEARGRGATLAAAFLGYARGIDLYGRDQVQTAAAELRSAEQAFVATGCPLRWPAALNVAIADYYQGRFASARRSLDALGARDDVRRYPSVLARVHWVQGLLRGVTGDLSGALEHYQEARGLFQRMGESDGMASADFLIAESLDLLGDHESAWRHRRMALGFSWRAAPEQRRSIHLDATRSAMVQKLPWAALTFQEPLFEPWSTAQVGALTEAHQTRARILGVTGDVDGALRDLESADETLAAIDDPGLRRRLEVESAMSRGVALLDHEPRDAVASLGRAIAYFEEMGATNNLPPLYLDRGRAQRALGRYRDAEADLARGIDLLEETHAALLAAPQRVSFLDGVWTLFDAIVDLEAGPLEDAGRAFSYAERARRTELLSIRRNDAPPGERVPLERRPPDPPLDIETVARAIPPDEALVCLVMVPDRLLRWVFRGGRWEFRPQSLTIARVESLVDRVRRSTEAHDEAAFRDAVTALYDLLLRPIEDLLPSSGTLVVVPDRRLDDVPYAALLDSREGRYVLERYATVVAPTAAMAAFPSADRPPARKEPALLVVGNPAFDPRRHPDLEPLPAAEAEARRIAALYPGALLLTGADATAERFLAHIATSDIIHFAGHAISDDVHPLLSALVMAPPPPPVDPNDLLTVLELQQQTASTARLVVLGTCRASGGGTERPGGAFSLARPFLAAGVPAVVGTQWAIGDRPAALILSAFHQEYRRGAGAVLSLRAAQLAALHGSDPETRSPLAWGAFLVNGTATRQADPIKEAS